MTAQRIWPEFHGADLCAGMLNVDSHGADDGYIFASVRTSKKKKLKLRIGIEDQILSYDLNGNGKYELFPLQFGSGRYTVTLYENVIGRQYRNIGTVSMYVQLNSPLSPFLVPNQYVNYGRDSELVTIADELCDGMDAQSAFNAICHYVKTHFVYDYVKSITVKPGVLPDIETTMRKHMGICQDLSAVAVAMLRTQGIPAKLVIGYADGQYHAWVTALVDGKTMRFDPTAALMAISKPSTYTTERVY